MSKWVKLVLRHWASLGMVHSIMMVGSVCGPFWMGLGFSSVCLRLAWMYYGCIIVGLVAPICVVCLPCWKHVGAEIPDLRLGMLEWGTGKWSGYLCTSTSDLNESSANT